MAKIDKTGDAAIMPLHKILMKMCGQTGYTPDAVFEGLLDYIIGYLNPSLTPEPIEGWKFKPQDTPTFHEMMQNVFRIYADEIPRRRWYAPFGDLYMAIHSGGGSKRQSRAIAVPRLAEDSKRGNRRDAERCQRQERRGAPKTSRSGNQRLQRTCDYRDN